MSFATNTKNLGPVRRCYNINYFGEWKSKVTGLTYLSYFMDYYLNSSRMSLWDLIECVFDSVCLVVF